MKTVNEILTTEKPTATAWDSPPPPYRRAMRPAFEELMLLRDSAGHATKLGQVVRGRQMLALADELSQARWDWGNRRTWTFIAGGVLAWFAIAAAAFFLPHGHEAATSAINPY